jgi:hypothetical protein
MKSSIWRALFETDSHDVLSAKERQFLDSGAAELICQNSYFIVVKINTYEAARFYCPLTTSLWAFKEDERHFNLCLTNAPIYMILRKMGLMKEPAYAFYQSLKDHPPADLHRFHSGYVSKLWPWRTQSDINKIKQELKDFPREFWKILVGTNPVYLEYIDSPSIELQLLAIENDLDAIKYIESPAPMVQWVAFKKSPDSIELVQPPECRDPSLVEKYEDIKAQRGY